MKTPTIQSETNCAKDAAFFFAHVKISGLAALFIFLFSIFSEQVSAQTPGCNNYTPTRTTGITYNDITSTGSPFSGWRNLTGFFTNDDNRSVATDIGFDFWYLGVRYTQFSVSTNGFIDFSNSAADGTGAGAYGYSNTRFTRSTLGTYLALTPFYEDMTTNQANADPLATDIKYLLSGAAPNRTLTIAWFEMSRYGETTPSNLNFQIVLHESTGLIDFIYGTMTFGTATWTYTNGMNNSTMAGPTAAELLTQQTANTSTYNNTPQNSLSTVPTTNSKIAFACAAPNANPASLSFTGVTQTAMTLNWTCAATNEMGFVIYNSTDGVNYNFVAQTAANTTSYVASVFASTTYYWKVYAVTDGYLSTALTGTQATLPAINIISITTGNWNTPGTWDCTCIPTAADNATIANGHVVTLDANGIVNGLTVGQGTSGQLTIGNNATGRTLTINTSLSIRAGAIVTTGATAATHSISIYGDIANAGTLNLAPSATRVCNVTFTKNGNQSITGSGATTTFNKITMSMTSKSNILDVTSTNFSAASNFLTINGGTFRLSTGASVTPFTTATTIKSTDGIWVNNAGATITTTGGTISFAGLVRASAGALNIGSASDHCLTSNGGTFTIDGGNVNIAGRLDNPSSSAYLTYFTMSAGTLTLTTQGSTTAGFAPFHMDQVGSTFNMTGGTIDIRKPGAGNLGFINTGATYTVTGGTLQIGDASTAAAQAFYINSNVPVYNLTISNGVAVTTSLTTNSLTAKGTVTINSGTFVANNLNVSVAGDWANSGTFTAGTGTVTFNGSTAGQTISGSTTTVFSNLTINNTNSGVTLSTPANVSGALTLTAGLVNTTSTNILTMQNGSTAPSLTDASTSFVNGPLKYQIIANTVNVAVNFPIGKTADCRPMILTVKHTDNTQYNYTGELFNGDAGGVITSPPATVDTLSGVHYWSINRTDNGGTSQPTLGLSGNQQIRLYFGTNDYVYQGSKLTIVKNTSASPTSGFDIGGTCSFAGNFSTPQSGYITSTSAPSTFTSFSTFTLGSLLTGWNSLPIELLKFTASPNNNKVDLKWTTQSETNNKYFTVERSGDGVNFKEMAIVNSKAPNGTSLVKIDYSTVDASPLSGTSYYRLKQTDLNGKFKYFNTVSVTFDKTKNINFTVYPNPNQGQFTVDFTGIENNHEVQILLNDVNGKEVYSNTFFSEDVVNSVNIIPNEKIGKGIYFCSLVVEGVKYVVKVVIN